MPSSIRSYPIFLGFLLSFLAFIAYIVNYFFFQFPGNNYYPYDANIGAILLITILFGCYFQFGKNSSMVKITTEVIYFFLVMAIISWATNAIQFTPFSPIDKQIIALESTLNIDMAAIISWTVHRPRLTKFLVCIYDSLPYQMSFLPLLIIFSRKFFYIYEYYCLILLTALIGFSFYYFFPTLGPASFTISPYFTETQQATGLKFNQIHHYLQPTTIEGGMIAMPSFHAIWGWLCLYLIRSWTIFFIILFPFYIALIASCVLLGWHYPLDLLGSFIVVVLAHTIVTRYKQN